MLLSPVFAFVWTAAPALRATTHVMRAPPLACGEWLSEADVIELQEEMSLAQSEAADASRSARCLANERDVSVVAARVADERIEELEIEIEAVRELAAQEKVMLREEIDELRRQPAGDNTVGVLPADANDLECELVRLSQELAIASDRAASAEDEAADLRAELEVLEEQLDELRDELRDGGDGAIVPPPLLSAFEGDADVQCRRIEDLEEQVAGLLEVIDAQEETAAELQELRPKLAALESKCRALENEVMPVEGW